MKRESSPAAELRAVSRRYGSLVALTNVSLSFRRGEATAIIGPSGSGKTTLLHLLAGIEAPDEGKVYSFGDEMRAIPRGSEMASRVGVMPQQFDLVPNLAVFHNVAVGNLRRWGAIRSLASLIWPRACSPINDALRAVGLEDRASERTSRLSGGEQQRVALARLLVQKPRVLLTDEPVSSLDPTCAEDLVRLLVGMARDDGHTLIASMHSVQLALAHFSRIIGLRDGEVAFDLPAAAVRSTHLDALYVAAELPQLAVPPPTGTRAAR